MLRKKKSGSLWLDTPSSVHCRQNSEQDVTKDQGPLLRRPPLLRRLALAPDCQASVAKKAAAAKKGS